ncbi:MAG: hypothetical protein HQL36_12615 [Alphaproteobacteria bacterium]|nr:hypothetical protein [Alphaproteobacteria bacterium]
MFGKTMVLAAILPLAAACISSGARETWTLPGAPEATAKRLYEECDRQASLASINADPGYQTGSGPMTAPVVMKADLLEECLKEKGFVRRKTTH